MVNSLHISSPDNLDTGICHEKPQQLVWLLKGEKSGAC